MSLEETVNDVSLERLNDLHEMAFDHMTVLRDTWKDIPNDGWSGWYIEYEQKRTALEYFNEILGRPYDLDVLVITV